MIDQSRPARWSLADTHCAYCTEPSHFNFTSSGTPECRMSALGDCGSAGEIYDLLIALRGELEAERKLADDLAAALRVASNVSFAAGEVGWPALARWEAARA